MVLVRRRSSSFLVSNKESIFKLSNFRFSTLVLSTLLAVSRDSNSLFRRSILFLVVMYSSFRVSISLAIKDISIFLRLSFNSRYFWAFVDCSFRGSRLDDSSSISSSTRSRFSLVFSSLR